MNKKKNGTCTIHLSSIVKILNGKSVGISLRQTDRHLETIKAAIVLINKHKERTLIVRIEIPSDSNDSSKNKKEIKKDKMNKMPLN